MRNKRVDQLISQMESHLECWKQFNYYVNLGRSKKFTTEDETQFLEIKSVLAQELELILGAIEAASPTREDIHTLLSGAPSIRYVSELNDGALRGLENQWHRAYISWQSLLGQLKVRQRQLEQKPFWSGLLGQNGN
ncbi:MAG: hypothetical protein L0Z50_02895 [Verrucomicrobiales bacterium]|nr:hypothetical protein [Verrucomicrobiales bacterium]